LKEGEGEDAARVRRRGEVREGGRGRGTDDEMRRRKRRRLAAHPSQRRRRRRRKEGRS